MQLTCNTAPLAPHETHRELNSAEFCCPEWYNLHTRDQGDPPPVGYMGMWQTDDHLPISKVCSKLIIDYAHEWSTNPEWNTERSVKIKSESGIERSNQLWIFNRSHPENHHFLKEGPSFKYDFFAVDCVWRKQQGIQCVATTPLLERPLQGLLMTAQIQSKPWRKEMLRGLFRSGQHSNLVVTTLQQTQFKDRDPKFAKWCIKNGRPLDEVKQWQDKREGYGRGWPCDHTLYDRTRYSVVFETYGCGGEFLGAKYIDNFPTEKTYRAILMGHPFILVAEPGLHRHLQSIGFKLYHDPIEKVDQLAQTVARWQGMSRKAWKRFAELAQHNLGVLDEFGTRELGKLQRKLEEWTRI
jgi:hypothetical protein